MARKRRRRIWEDDEKRRIVAQTRVPGVSVSQVRVFRIPCHGVSLDVQDIV